MPERAEKGLLALTGATGFVGSHVLRTALEAGWRVRALARDPSRLPALPGLEAVPGHLEDEAALSRLMEDASAAIHLAGLVAAARREDFHRINAEGARAAARAARRQGVPRFVHVSSLAAREPHLSPYAASKRASEEMVAAIFADMPGTGHVTVRPPAVYGPGDRATLGLVDQLSRRRALLPGSADMRLSLIHVSDLAAALLHLAENGDAEGEILEMDDGRPGGYTWPELAEEASRALGRKVRLALLPRPLVRLAAAGADAASRLTGRAFMLSAAKVRELYHPDWVARPPRMQERTQWRPRIGFAEGFRATLQWYCEQGWLPDGRLPSKGEERA